MLRKGLLARTSLWMTLMPSCKMESHHNSELARRLSLKRLPLEWTQISIMRRFSWAMESYSSSIGMALQAKCYQCLELMIKNKVGLDLTKEGLFSWSPSSFKTRALKKRLRSSKRHAFGFKGNWGQSQAWTSQYSKSSWSWFTRSSTIIWETSNETGFKMLFKHICMRFSQRA